MYAAQFFPILISRIIFGYYICALLKQFCYMNFRLIITAIFFLSTSCLYAQTDTLSEVIIQENEAHSAWKDQDRNATVLSRNMTDTLSEIIIQENRIQTAWKDQNRNVTVLDRQQIARLPVKSVNELLSAIAGIDVRQRGAWGTQADIGIDGGSFDQTLVLLNGVKISDPQTGHNMMNLPVPLAAIERIEVLRGPAARIYGINALAGVINIITKKPDQQGISAHIYGGSSFRKDDSTGQTYTGMGAEVFAGWSGKIWNQQIGLSHARGNGYRYNTGFRQTKLMYQNQISASDKVALSLSGGYVDNSFGANGYYSAPGDIESEEAVQTALGSVAATIQLNSFWEMKPRIAYRYNKDDYIFTRKKPEAYRNIHETNTIDAELNNTFRTKAGSFGLGLEWRNENIHSARLGDNQRDNFGIFGEYQWNYRERFSLNAGAYVNYNSAYGWNVFPGLDLGWRFLNDFRIYANVGTGERLPTYTDLYYVGPSNIGNPDLKPEQMLQAEGGVHYGRGRWNGRAGYFYRYGNQFIDWARSDTSQLWQPENYNELLTHGITFALEYRFSGEKKDVDFQAGLSYTYLAPKAGTVTDGNGNSVLSKYTINSLKHQLCAHAGLLLLQHLNIELTGRYHERLNAAAVADYSLQSYFLADMRIAYTLTNWSFYADLSNIGDVQYIDAGVAPMPGRWMTVGLKWNCWK